MDLEGLDELVQIIQAHNKTFKGTNVKMVATLWTGWYWASPG